MMQILKYCLLCFSDAVETFPCSLCFFICKQALSRIPSFYGSLGGDTEERTACPGSHEEQKHLYSDLLPYLFK